MPERQSIMTCEVVANPPDTDARTALRSADGEHIVGWATRKPGWPEGVYHVSGCYRGVAHLVGYVESPGDIPNAIKEFGKRMLAQLREGAQPGEDGV